MRLRHTEIEFELPATGRIRYCAWWAVGAIGAIAEFHPLLYRLYELFMPRSLQGYRPGGMPEAFTQGYDTTGSFARGGTEWDRAYTLYLRAESKKQR